MFNFPLARPLLCVQYLLHGFKQCERDDGVVASIKPFLVVTNEAEIRTVGNESFDGSPGKWRLVLGDHTQVSQKLCQRN